MQLTHNLKYIHDLIDFRKVDQEVADVAEDKLTNHLWYLSQEVVLFSLFSKHASLTDSAKEKIAEQHCKLPQSLLTTDYESLYSCPLQETPHRRV